MPRSSPRFSPRNRLPAPKVRIETLAPVRPRVRAGIAAAPASERTTAPPKAAASRNCLLETSEDNEPPLLIIAEPPPSGADVRSLTFAVRCLSDTTLASGGWLRGGRRRLAQEVHDGGEELRLHLIPLGCSGDVAHNHLQALRHGPQVRGGPGREGMRAILARDPLPILFGRPGVRLRLLLREPADLGHGRIGVAIGRQRDVELVPEPLPDGREIEIVFLDGERVHEGHTAARGMARAGPIPHPEKSRL